MKKILLLWTSLIVLTIQGQTIPQNSKLAITKNIKQNNATRIVVQDSITKELNWILKSSLVTPVSFTNITNKPTTLSGYGITDAYPNTNPAGYISSIPVQSFSSLTGKPTTLGGYGIIDGQVALGFIPENNINKSDSYTTSSTTTYPNTKALVDGLALKANDLDVIHKSGNETKDGQLTINSTFTANKVLVNQTIDNTFDALQVNGTISSSSATLPNQVVVKSQLDGKQDTLVSTTNIKTINGNSVLGSGNLVVGETIDSIPIDSSLNSVSSNGVFDALNLKANTDSPILYHNARWFTPSGTVTTNLGSTYVTSVGTQFTSLMIGSKLIINGEQRIITSYTSTTVIQVNSPYSIAYIGVAVGNWGVYSKAYEILSTFSRFYDVTGILVFRTAAGNNVEISNGLSSGTNAGFFSDNFTVRSDYRYLFSSTSSAFGTKDLGFRRNSAGILEIYDGITATGLLANRRDLLVRNVNASQLNITALNTAPASATATGTLGEIRYTADFVYVCIATNTWVRTALTTW